MRNLLMFSLLFTGVFLTSCSEEGNSEDSTQDLELNKLETDAAEPESDEDEVLDANTEMTWKSYENERFQFCVEYPTNFLKEMGESENHDGNSFANANESSEMRASGILNVLDESIEEAFASATENGTYYNDEQTITYKRQKDNWFVVSGNYYESIFYVKTVLKGDTFYTLYFEYHPSEEEKFKTIIKRTTKNFPSC